MINLFRGDFMKGFSEFAKALFIHGSFSEPFLSMALNEDTDEAWKMYFLSIKSGWKKEYAKALGYIDTGLKILKKRTSKKSRYKKVPFYDLTKYEKGKNLFYLLCIHKLEILEKMKNQEAEVLYEKLKNNYSAMPTLARKVAAPTFFNHYSRKNKSNIKKPRIWSAMYGEDLPAWIFILLGKARRKAKDGELLKAFSLFLKAFRIAKNIPHPTGMINALNDMAWYTRMRHPYWACEMAKRAVYWAGWYSEDIANVFYTFDTLFECQRLSNDVNLYETANVILLTSEYLPEGHGRGTQGHYHDRIESCKYIVPNFKTSMYENLESLREFLSRQIHSINSAFQACHIARDNISAMLNGKVKKVRGNTLKRFIDGLNIEVSSEKVPFPVLNEYYKMKVENNFNESIEKLERMKTEKRMVLFISTYTAYLDRRKSLPYLSRKGKLKEAMLLEDMEEFKEFMSKRYETMIFVNSMIQAHPFIQARKALTKEFLERMPKRTKERFIQGYLTLDEEDRKVIDRFSRDYIRYDIRWGMRIKILKEMEKYAKSLRLKKTPTALAYWALDREHERTKLVEALENLG